VGGRRKNGFLEYFDEKSKEEQVKAFKMSTKKFFKLSLSSIKCILSV
jgi:hypothetical protein